MTQIQYTLLYSFFIEYIGYIITYIEFVSSACDFTRLHFKHGRYFNVRDKSFNVISSCIVTFYMKYSTTNTVIHEVNVDTKSLRTLTYIFFVRDIFNVYTTVLYINFVKLPNIAL